MRCEACRHPKRPLIDQGLVAGVSVRELATRYGLGKSTVYRHKGHVKRSMVAAFENREHALGANLAGRLAEYAQIARGVLVRASKHNHFAGMLTSVRRLIELLELEARLAGKLPTGPSVHINIATLDLTALDVTQRSALLERLLVMRTPIPVTALRGLPFLDADADATPVAAAPLPSFGPLGAAGVANPRSADNRNEDTSPVEDASESG
jgi:hypothetical protein